LDLLVVPNKQFPNRFAEFNDTRSRNIRYVKGVDFNECCVKIKIAMMIVNAIFDANFNKTRFCARGFYYAY